MAVGGQPGNNNAGKNKPWREAIAWALEKHKLSQTDRAQALRDIATQMIDKALGGDMAAMKELGDRLDGKAPQDVQLNSSVDLASLPIDDLMELFHKIRDEVNSPEAD